MASLGIDFGTTNSVFVVYDKEKHRFDYFHFDHNGEPSPTPSVVCYSGREVIVGAEAKAKLHYFEDVPGNCIVTSVKSKLSGYEAINVLGENKSPYEIAGEILKFLKAKAEGSTNNEKLLARAVFTIPINFNGVAREQLRKAAGMAGIKLTTFIHEPFAAVLGYYYAKNKTQKEAVNELKSMNGKNILVFDYGGGTLDVSIVYIDDSRMEEVGKAELTDKAGDAFDRKLFDYVWEKFVDSLRHKYTYEYIERHKRGKKLSNLLSMAEDCKKVLSKENEANFHIPNVFDGNNIDMDMTREKFEEIIQVYVDEAEDCINQAMEEAGLGVNNIEKVLLIGGSCNVPCVKDMVCNIFGHKVESVDNPDMVIAQGAAVISELHLLPYLSKTLGLMMSDDCFFPLCQSLPVAAGKENDVQHDFICVDDRSGFAEVLIGEEDRHQKVRLLGEVLRVPVNKALKHYGQEIRIMARIDENLVLHIIGQSKLETDSENRTADIVRKEYHKLSFGLVWKQG